MKKILFFIFALMTTTTFAQLVTFDKTTYFTGDQVNAIVISGNNFTVGNDITSQSEIHTGGEAVSNLGVIPGPGIYKLIFQYTDNTTETYLITCFDNDGQVHINNSVIPVNNNFGSADDIREFNAKLIAQISSNDFFTKVVKATATDFLSSHVLQGTITVTACISAVSIPAFGIVCSSNLVGLSKDLEFTFLKQTIMELYVEQIINDDQKNRYLKAIGAISGAVDVFTADGLIDKLVSATAATINITVQNETVNLVVDQHKQLYDQTKLLLKLSPQ